MSDSTKMRLRVTGAILVAFALRFYFIWRFPFYDAGDTPIYQELAHNWFTHGIYGLKILGHLSPVDMRTPGYVAFLAAIYSVFGESARAVMIAQAGVDMLTCLVVAAMAAVLAPKASRPRVALAALWLAAICPFTIELYGCGADGNAGDVLDGAGVAGAHRGSSRREGSGPALGAASARMPAGMRWLLGGIVVGFGTLVRPEAPLILAGVGAVLVFLWWRPANWPKLARAAILMAVGLMLPLLPWAARNWRVLHKVQFLAPRYSELPGEFTPHGFFSWEKTWLWRFRDVFLVSWNLNGAEIQLQDLPASAFDSAAERERVANLLEQYNDTMDMTPELDQQFAEIAWERTERHPLRTYVRSSRAEGIGDVVYAARRNAAAIGQTCGPSVTGGRTARRNTAIRWGFFWRDFAYGAMALGGAWRCRGDPAAMMLVAFIVIRTAFLTTMETPEPRYVLECFPAVFALGAQLWCEERAL